DKGNANDIHPADKKPVGERLALFARGTTYGENVVYSGPVFEALRIEGSTAILTFDHVGSGLASLDREPLAGFSVADGEGNFVEATAKISGKEVHVSAESVPEPRAVRYAWESNPEGLNFVNEEGLPASPFRTDSW
ncbi:MAG: 9-O-acetylesterase, partial [Verrucomicrobiota bacterium]